LAMRYLHSRSILHCDLKSSNILIDESWNARICDFGLSRYKMKFLHENRGRIGTPHWMAPEILRGEKYTEAADVYSYGMVVWEMLTRKVPYYGLSSIQIIGTVGYNRHCVDRPETGERHLLRVLKHCLQYKSEKRPTFEYIVDYLTKAYEGLEKRKVLEELSLFFN